MKVIFDLQCHRIGSEVGIVDFEIAGKGEVFPVTGIQAVESGGVAHFRFAPCKVSFGFLMVEAVFRFVALYADIEVGGQLHHVAVCAFTAEEMDEISCGHKFEKQKKNKWKI